MEMVDERCGRLYRTNAGRLDALPGWAAYYG